MIAPGQVWELKDPREPGLRVRVVRPTLPFGVPGGIVRRWVCELVSPSERRPRTRETILLDRTLLSRWRLVEEVAA